ncbi:hypothetical protein HA466_0213320 [Hirschfeldia incana]|nr:hypothetical protein HA466_0213320 [Hirschfeldia incana]
MAHKTDLKEKEKKENPTTKGTRHLHPSDPEPTSMELWKPPSPGDLAGGAELREPPPPATLTARTEGRSYLSLRLPEQFLTSKELSPLSPIMLPHPDSRES